MLKIKKTIGYKVTLYNIYNDTGKLVDSLTKQELKQLIEQIVEAISNE